MIFELKDLIYVCIYVASMAGVFAAMKYRVEKVEDVTTSIKDIMFLEKGGLNLIDNSTCIEHRQQVKTDIRVVKSDVDREAENTRRAFDEIRCLNQNIIKLMLHMKVEPVIFNREKDGC